MYKDYIYNNKEYFLTLKPNIKTFFCPMFIIFIIILLIFSNYFKVYDVTEGKIVINRINNSYSKNLIIDYKDTNSVLNGKYIVIDGKKYIYKVINKKLVLDNETLQNFNSLNVNFNCDKKYLKNNAVINVKIYSNKEKIITKLKKIIF